MDNVTPETIAGALGVALALIFAYVPKVRDWYYLLPIDQQRLVRLGGMLVITLGIFGLACSPLAADLSVTIPCTAASAIDLLKVFFVATVANVAAMPLLPKQEQYEAQAIINKRMSA